MSVAHKVFQNLYKEIEEVDIQAMLFDNADKAVTTIETVCNLRRIEYIIEQIKSCK